MINYKPLSKKAVLGVVVMVAVVAIGVWMFFLGQEKLKMNEPSAINTIPVAEKQLTSVISGANAPSQEESEKLVPAVNVIPTKKPAQAELDKIDTSAWKTYTNADYGYEIKYPSDWSIITREDFQVHFLAPETPKFDVSTPGEGDVSIIMKKSGFALVPDQFFSKTPVTIGESSGTLYVGVNGGQDPEYPDVSITTLDMIKDSRELNINFPDYIENGDGDKYIGIYYKMLDSFRFIK